MPVTRIIHPHSRLNNLLQPGNPLLAIQGLQRGLEGLRTDLVSDDGLGTIPAVPQDVVATNQPNNVVRVTWSAIDDPDASEYHLYRADDDDGTNATFIGNKSHTAGQVLSFDWMGSASSTPYYFAVEAIDAQGLSSGLSAWVTPSTEGGWFSGSGTFDNPITGRRFRYVNGIGVIETWSGGQLSSYTSDDGAQYVAGGLIRQGINGIETLGNFDNSSVLDTGWRTFTTVAEDASFGTQSWIGPANARVSDDTYADTGLLSGVQMKYLKFTGPTGGNAVPSTATIVGVVIEVECKRDRIGGINRVFAVKGGVIGSTNVSDTQGGLFSFTDTLISYGGPSNLWGYASITPAEANASNYGFVLSAYLGTASPFNAVGEMWIDYARIKFFYTDTSGSSPWNFGGTRLANIGQGVLSTDAVRMDQLSGSGFTVLAVDATSGTIPGGGVYTDLLTFTLPAGSLGASGRLVIDILGRVANSSGSSWQVVVGGTTSATMSLSAGASQGREVRMSVNVANNTASSQRVQFLEFGNGQYQTDTMTVDTSGDLTITLKAQTTSGTVTRYHIMAYVMSPP